MAEAPGTHDPNFLPPDIPAPQDDGAALHLAGTKLPDVALPATSGPAVNLSKLKGRTVLYIYPRTGVPGVDAPPGWDQIPGARGCTRNLAASATTLPSSKRSASSRSMACRRKTPVIRARRQSGCTCRSPFCPMRT
jgi:hypothetical protein